MTRTLFSIFLMLLCAAVAGSARAQSSEPVVAHRASGGGLTMDVDYAVFRQDSSDSLRLEVYYKVYSFGLGFNERDDGRWAADYEVRIVVNDNKGYPLDRYEKDRTVEVDSFRKTRSLADFRTSMAQFVLAEGKYKIVCQLIDDDAGNQALVEFDVKTEHPSAKKPRISNVLFAQAVTTQGDHPNIFERGNLVVIPSVSRLFGTSTGEKLLYYVELYDGTEDYDKVTIETKIRRHRGSMVYRDTLTTELDEPVKRQLREISLVEFRPGKYELEIAVLGRRLKEIDKIKEPFTVQWDGEALVVHDFKTAVRQLRLITDSKELDSLEKAETPEQRRSAYNAFWRSKDPTPGTAQNEWKMEFYRRVGFANREFSVMRKEGWRTDRGMLYIKRGAPDQVEDVPMSPGYPPYQIWYYYDGGPYSEYTFIDSDFDGDYRLTYPVDGLNRGATF